MKPCKNGLNGASDGKPVSLDLAEAGVPLSSINLLS